MVLGEKFLQIVDGLFCLPGGCINLHPIAGGEDHVFLQGGKGM